MDSCSSVSMRYNHLPPVQSIVDQSKYTEYPCLTGISADSNVPLEFRVERTGFMVDPRQLYLAFTIKVKKSDGSELAANENVSTVNNIGYSMFSGVDFYMQDRKVSNSDGYYPYMSYINLLLHTTQQEKDYYLREALWRKDTSGFMDRIGTDEAGVKNEGYVERQAYIQQSTSLNLLLKVLLDFHVSQLIPEGTELFFRFNRIEPSKCLLAESGEYKIEITRAKLIVMHVLPTSRGKSLIPKSINIPAVRYRTISHFVGKGYQNIDIIPYTGKLPRRMYVFQTLSTAYNGDISKNIFNFQLFNLRRVQLFKNGESVPMTQGVDVKEDDGQLLYTLSLNAINRPEVVSFNSFEFKYGYCVMVFDLTKDFSAGLCDYNNPTETGTLRLALDYSKPLESSITIFCMLELSGVLHMDESRFCSWLE